MKKAKLEEILELAEKLETPEKLMLISKIALNLSRCVTPKRPRKPISSYAFCGIWEDREDMKNSVEWVRDLRDQEERRSRRD